ncbi:MAG: 16S rRNA (guanine(966)-N(2))-methyltransferase RsmD, partial [Lachnospiraceae bacterium]|nr:16S rRNA (guanine(966)-N(2))-methyltransferase RsmD [Lachnospiraceae bacterium]
MRVIGGKARSLPLKTPKGMNTRPTTDRIKETLFNMLMPYLGGAVFIDCFSGSGAIGIEALSRGASKAYFLDNNKDAIKCIKDNLTFTKLADSAVVVSNDCFVTLRELNLKEADIIFMDPPYMMDKEEELLELLRDRPYVTPNTLIVIEALIDKDFSFVTRSGFQITKEKTYKTNKHI